MQSFSEESRDAAIGWIAKNCRTVGLPGFIDDQWLSEIVELNYPGGLVGFFADWNAGQKA